MTWSQKLAQSRSIKQAGASMVFDRAVLYRDILEDADFQEACKGKGADPNDVLSKECADICCDSSTLIAVLSAYPDRQVWRQRRFEELVAEVVQNASDKRKESQSRVSKSWKQEYSALKEKYDSLLRKNEILEARLCEAEKFAGHT